MGIGIDMGHGIGKDRGADGFILEETIINDVGAFAISKLIALGHEVIETRPTQADTVMDSLSQRVNKANDNNVDLFVCLHANAGGGYGTEVFTYQSKELVQARNVLDNIVALGFRNRGIKGESLYVTNHTNADSFLIEVCFVDSQSDVDLYNSLGAEVISDAIVKGIVGETIKTDYSPIISTQSQSTQSDSLSPIQKAKQFVGNRCAELQTLLNNKGYNCGEIDGVMGQNTYSQLVQFQKDNNLVSDALAGDKTFAKLNEVVQDVSSSPTPIISQSPTSNNVLLIQQLCNFYGANIIEDSIYGNQTESAISNYLPLVGIPYNTPRATLTIQRILGIEEDGIFLYGTEASVKEFQANHNLQNDGIVGFNSYKTLALS